MDKRSKERHEVFESLRKIHTDHSNVGTIKSAIYCDDDQVFICTTLGNFYIPKSAYDANLAMLGKLTVESLKQAHVPMLPTIEGRPHSLNKLTNRGEKA